MTDPLTALGLAIGKAAAGQVGSLIGRRALDWARGSEAKQLVKLLKPDFPRAEHMLVQWDVLGHLWVYAETGEMDVEQFKVAVRPLTADDAEAAALVEAIRTRQWRAMRDERRTHFEFLRLRAELSSEIDEHSQQIRVQLDEILARLTPRLPAARQLPAATERFVDRLAELEAAEAALSTPPQTESALMLCVAGMAGIGKSALALEVARRHADAFPSGTLYVDFRAPSGGTRSVAEVATRLLRDLGVPLEAISAGDGAVGQLRSLLSEIPALVLLDNAISEHDVRDLIPPNPDSVVVVTSRMPLAGLGQAHLLVLTELGPGDAVELLAGFVDRRATAEPGPAAAIATACHGLPLAIAVVGARLRRRPERSLAEFAAELDSSLESVDDPSETIRAALTSAMAGISDGARRALLLATAIEIVDITAETIAVAAGLPDVLARRVLEELEDRQLVKDGKVHQLLRSLVVQLATEELAGDDLASARERRVRWLVQTARPHLDDLGG